MRADVSVGREVTTYVKVPMSAGLRRHQWKASEISHFESHTGPSEVSASQIFYRNRGGHAPICMAFGVIYLSLYALTLGITSSGTAE